MNERHPLQGFTLTLDGSDASLRRVAASIGREITAIQNERRAAWERDHQPQIIFGMRGLLYESLDVTGTVQYRYGLGVLVEPDTPIHS